MYNAEIWDTYDGEDSITPGPEFLHKSGPHLQCDKCSLWFHVDHAMSLVDPCPLCDYDQNMVNAMKGLL